MKSRWIRSLPLACLLAALPAFAAPPGDGNLPMLEELVVSGIQPGPGLWKVSRDGNVMWVLGTLAPLPKRMEWSPDEVRERIAASGVVLMSSRVSLKTRGGALGGVFLLPSALRARNNPGGQKLRDVLPAQDYTRWELLKARYIGRDHGVEKRRPIAAAMALREEAFDRNDLSWRDVVGREVKRAARRSGVPVREPTVTLKVDNARAALKEFSRSQVDDGHHCMDVALPRNVREQGVGFGHRRSSTTLLNYFHMSWMTKSRAIAALHPYDTRHAAAVALGISVAGADKILQRKKPLPVGEASAGPVSIWVVHAAGAPTATPGNTSFNLPRAKSLELGSPASARLVSRMLQDIQRGLSPSQAALTYGLSDLQANRLADVVSEIEKRRGFKFGPRPGRGGRPRAARLFESARPAERILTLLDEGSAVEQALVLDLAQCHLLWARRGKRDEFVWPTRTIDRMVDLLRHVGIAELQIQRSNVAGETGFEQPVVLRYIGKKATMNHAMAWALTVAHATSILR